MLPSIIESKEFSSCFRSGLRHGRERFRKTIRNRDQDRCQIGRFIPTILRLRRHRSRSKERRVRFDHQAIQRNLLNQFMEVHSPTLVANPPGDANVQPHLKVCLQFFTRARETVKHGGDAFPASGQNVAESLASITLMQKERHLQFLCQRHLRLKPLLLLRPRGEISIEIQAAFADRHDLLVRREVSKFQDGGFCAVSAVMGMNPGGCEKLPGIFAAIRTPSWHPTALVPVMTILRTPAAKARSMTCFRSTRNERCVRFTPISIMSCDASIPVDYGCTAQEALAAAWIVSFNAANNCSDTRSYSSWSTPSNPISFHDPMPPNTQADWQASKRRAASWGPNAPYN